MLTNYLIMAFLTTLYWAFLNPPGPLKKLFAQHPSKVLLSFRYSVRIALDTAIAFALAMLLAAIYTYASTIASGSRVVNSYSTEKAGYLAFWSILPVLVFHYSTTDSIRRTKSRAIVYCFMLCLIIVDFSLWVIVHGASHTY